MDVDRALDQIAEIHQQIAKGEIYRGYRPLPVAASGVVGFAAAWLQPRALSSNPAGFVAYWSAIGAMAALIGFSGILHHYVMHDTVVGRRRTRRVLGQFVPSLAAGAALAVSIVHASPASAQVVPGLWAVCFGLGALASGPYLPAASRFVAVWYLAAGFWLVLNAHALSGWRIGAVFGAGQLIGAVVLWRDDAAADRAK